MHGTRWFRSTHAVLVVALVALALPLAAAPSALAAAPSGLAFLPVSGAVGTPVTIVGTGFNDASPVTSVAFNGTPAAFAIGSNSTIATTVPAGATSGVVSVTDAEGTSATLLAFTVSDGSGLLPILTGFLPTEGEPGDTVSLLGTGLDDATGVLFNGVPGSIVPGTDGISAIVPNGATSGPVTLITPGGSVTSLRNFLVTRDGAASDRHARTVSLKFQGKRAQGKVTTTDGFDGCSADVKVKIQKRSRNGWRTVASDRTDASGRYAKVIAHRHGTYRAVAPKAKVNGGSDVCMRRSSGLRRAG